MLNKKYNISKKMASVALSLMMTTGAVVPSFASMSSIISPANGSVLQGGKDESKTKRKLSG